MHSAPHRTNSDFQLRYFIANSCHTADIAWCVMYEQKLDVQIKLENAKAQLLRRKAKLIEIEQKLESTDPVTQLNAQADLIEWKSGEGLLEMGLLGAEQELATITSIMAELEPQRKYADLPILEAAQAAQREEWLLEFRRRTENYLLSIGTIPEDHLNAMRNHPDFESNLVPYITNVLQKISVDRDKMSLLTNNRALISG
jgi:hypothetical protein